MQRIAGIDEAGRGPLAGPVVAAAVVFDNMQRIPKNAMDSKKLSEKKRQQLYDEIQLVAVSWGIGTASVAEIDELNIHHATLLAMRRAVAELDIKPVQCLVDGKFTPDIQIPCQAVIGGDASVPIISAASILAKVYRDQIMLTLDQCHPEYAFAQHKGYGTAAHLAALAKYGPCEHHRRSFRPVAKLLSN